MSTLNLNQAATLLHMSTSALLAKIHQNKIPAAKPAKAWVFIEEDLLTYLRSLYTTNQNEQDNKKCQSTKETTHTGTTSHFQTDKEYKDLLEQK